ncbi:hypothetical protein D3C77_333670 [compost metagenome]
MDGHEALAIFRDFLKAEEGHVDQLQDRQAGVGEAPTATQVRPDSMGENLCERPLGIFTNDGASIRIQQPMLARLLVVGSKADRLHHL